MYCLVRDDLNLAKGQLAVQCSHAFMKAGLLTLSEDAPRWANYLQESFIKVCLRVPNLAIMLECQRFLHERGIVAVTFEDTGYPQFLGKPEQTTLGIGPCRKSELSNILRRFQTIR